jgi:hypothetical protein
MRPRRVIAVAVLRVMASAVGCAKVVVRSGGVYGPEDELLFVRVLYYVLRRP